MAVYKSRRKNKFWQQRLFKYGAALVLIIIAVIVVLELTHTINWFGSSNSQSTTQSAPSDTSTNPAGATSNSGSQSGTDKSQDSKSPVSAGSTGSYSGTLIAPYGRLVSQHNPSSTNTVEQSACITSAKVTCTISFSLDGKTISLKSQTTDGSGTAYWTWTPKQYGLTSGAWTITAVASTNGQQKSTVDPNGKLVIP